MTGHSGQDHNAFIEAISTAAEQYRRSLAAQYESREEHLKTQYRDRENDQNAVISRLRAENEELRSLLRRPLTDSPKPSTPSILKVSESRVPSSPAPKGVSPPPTLHEWASVKDLQTAYSKLLAKFQLVESNFKKAKDLLERRKSDREHWASRTAILQEKLDAIQRAGHAPLSVARDSSPSRAAAHQLNDPGRQDTKDFSSHSDMLPVLGGPGVLSLAGPDTPPAAVRQTPVSTQSEPEEGTEVALPPLPGVTDQSGPTVKQEPSSDSPIMVSERPVRKRKRGAEPDKPDHAKIKVEASAYSSPIMRVDRSMLNSDDSLDLGDVAQRISTPRKRRDGTIGHGDGPTPSTEPQLPRALLQAQPGLYAKATANTVKPAPLTPIDANRRLGRVISKSSGTRRIQKDIEHGVGTLAEDGISYGLKGAIKRKDVETPVSKNRLDDLLNTPGVGDPRPIISRSVPRTLSKATTPRDDLLMPRPRELPFEKLAHGGTKQRMAENPEPSPSVVRRSKSPKKREAVQGKTGVLRSKPLSELNLDDFKINPRVNEGVNYAFSDVVRDRSERAALPGCTDPHCCGEEFRSLAISQRPNPPLTSEQRREEQKLLEDYLGDHAYQLGSMDQRERANVWVDAKTHELANKYGKHRHRYARMRSPPGFWNADFPSTQEMEDERIEAAKRERRTIEDRRREAMRPGGRWVFRDE